MSSKQDSDKHRRQSEVSSSSADMSWNRTGDWSFYAPVYADRAAPCAVKCPLNVPINKYMHLVADGRYREAWEVITASNPLPAVTGRVCYHDCEGGCNRSEFDEELNIHSIERFIGDAGIDENWQLPAPPETAVPAPVAVLGSGPAGLGCAYSLRMAGYPVVVYEEAAAPGGMLRVGVPEFRMPRKLLDAELTRLERIGVEFRTGKRITDLAELNREVYGVFLASGAHGSRPAGVEGDSLPGAWFGLEFLKRYNAGSPPDVGRRLAVIGGGNTSLDVARAGRRLGVEVDLYYRRTEEEMPAHPEELEEARAEGVRFHFQVAPERLVPGDNGRVAKVSLVRMRRGEADDSGRARPVPVDGSGFDVPADTVVFAIGERPELDYLKEQGARDGGRLAVDVFGRTSIPGVFAGGDIIPGENSVAHALADGIAAGRNLAGLLKSYGPDGLNARIGEPVAAGELNLAYFGKSSRVEAPANLSAAPSGSEETGVTLTDDQARAEAGRCFSCGTCVDCDTCLVFCPDLAIYCREGSYLVRADFCKGCGICAEECPRGVIKLEKKDE